MKTVISRTVWTILLTLVVLDLPQAFAQIGAPTINVFPPAPRSLRQNLVRAKKAIDEARFSDAVAELGMVLTGATPEQPQGGADENQDFFIEVVGQPGVQTSIKAEAQRMLGAMPPKGRELFELQFGADARLLLETAVRTANINQLNEVVRRYFHTTAGYEAALLLGRLHLDHGRPLAAALCLQRVANVSSAAPQYEPELSLLLAACWQLVGQPGRAKTTLAALPSPLPRGQIQFGDQELRELPQAEAAVAWLTEHFRVARSSDAETREWPLFRGNPARNAVRSGGLPLKRSRWQVPLVVDDHDRDLIAEARVAFVEQGIPMLPVVQPLAVGNVVVMRSSDRLLGIDFQTGKRIWSYPWWDLSPEEELQSTNPLLPPQNARENRLGALRERLWQDVPFGQVSSDGNAVYLLDGMRQSMPQVPRQLRFNRPRGMNFPMEAWVLQNELVALDLQREGYMLWKVGGDTGGEEPQLAGVFFLGPPLPLFGHLYLIAELKGELRLVVLDAVTGRQQWSQQLAHLEALAGIDEQVRRYSGATPSFADGVLVCPTSAGAVVAVDVATRTLLWGYQYTSQRDMLGRPSFMQAFPTSPHFQANRWQDSAVTIAEGSVVITPAEADVIVCLDLLTGKPRWAPQPRNRDLADMLYVAGVHDGNVVLVGKDRMLALSLKDGKAAWSAPVSLAGSAGEMISGRGFLSEEHYYLPTTAGSLIKIDLKAGKIAERSKTDHVLGNLIAFEDEIISVAADRAAAFYQIEPLRERVATRLAEQPKDPWALARQGELLVHDGRTADALAALQRAHLANPQDEGVRSLLVDTFLSALEEDFARHRGAAAQVAALIDSDKQRIRFWMLMAAGSQKAGDHLASADHYGKLVRALMGTGKGTGPQEWETLLPAEANWSVRTDRFLSARLQQLHESGDSEVRAVLDQLVAELGMRVHDRSAAELRQFLHVLGFHVQADAQRIQLAEKLIPGGDLLEAELVLGPVLDRAKSPLRGAALALASDLYIAGRKPQMLARVTEELRTTWADVAVRAGKTGREYAERARELLPDPVSPAEWPWGRTVVSEAREPTRQTIYAVHPSFTLQERRGAALDGLKLEFDFQRGNTSLHDGNGTPVQRLPHLELRAQIEAGLWRTAADGHLLFAALGGNIVAIDTLRPNATENEATLWREALWSTETEAIKPLPRDRRNPLSPVRSPEYRWGDQAGRPVASVGPMTATGATFQKIRAITSLDPLTGHTVWVRHDFEQGREIFGDHEFVLVDQATETPGSQAEVAPDAMSECTALSAVDGRLLGKRQLPHPSRRWVTRGRHVLAWESQGEKIRLHLWDVAAQADVWSESFPLASRGCLIEHDAVAVLEPSGRFVVRRLDSAAGKVETRVEPAPGTVSIQVLAAREQWLLIVNDNEEAQAEPEQRRRVQTPPLTQINGKVYALEKTTGEARWPVPAIVRDFGLLPNQPPDAPALWFVRAHGTGSSQFGPGANARTDVLCLDRRTGAALLEKQDVTSFASSFDILTNVQKGEVTLALPQVQYTVRFTADPRPPAPPFQYSRDGNRMDAALQKVGNWMETIKDVLTPMPQNLR